jgi:hypothetical protein
VRTIDGIPFVDADEIFTQGNDGGRRRWWGGDGVVVGDMLKSDYATGAGQGNPHTVDHALSADNGPA